MSHAISVTGTCPFHTRRHARLRAHDECAHTPMRELGKRRVARRQARQRMVRGVLRQTRQCAAFETERSKTRNVRYTDEPPDPSHMTVVAGVRQRQIGEQRERSATLVRGEALASI